MEWHAALAGLSPAQQSALESLQDVAQAPTAASPAPSVPPSAGEGTAAKGHGRETADTASAAAAAAAAASASASASAARLRALLRLQEGSEQVVCVVDRMVSELDGVAAQYGSVSGQADAISSTCESLLAEQTFLLAQVKRLREPLRRFEMVQQMAAQLGLPPAAEDADGAAGAAGHGAEGAAARQKRQQQLQQQQQQQQLVSPSSAEFVVLLKRLRSTKRYIEAHQDFLDGPLYLNKASQLQHRALFVARQHLEDLLNRASESARHANDLAGGISTGQGTTAGATTLESSAVFSRFFAISTQAREIVQRIFLFCGDEGLRTIADMQRVYLNVRQPLFRWTAPFVLRAQPTSSSSAGGGAGSGGGGADPATLLRLGGVVTMQWARAEAQLFRAIFGDAASLITTSNSSSSTSTDKAQPAQNGHREDSGRTAATDQNDNSDVSDDVSDDDYDDDELEPSAGERAEQARVLHKQADDVLRSLLTILCSLLQQWIRPHVIHLGNVDALCQVIHTCREQVLDDCSDPLVQEAMEVCMQDIISDASERLIYAALNTLRLQVDDFVPKANDLAYPACLRVASPSGDDDLTELWYPPLRATLVLLSKMYNVVDTQVFQDVASTGVTMCTASMHRAAKQIRSAHGGRNGDLFLIKYLLVLREQLAPFALRFTTTHRDLDFTNTATALSQLLHTASAAFSSVIRWNSDNPLLVLAREGAPLVRENQIDSRQVLDEAVRAACMEFAHRCQRELAQPLMDFMEKPRALLSQRRQHDSQQQRQQPQQQQKQPQQQTDLIYELDDAARELFAQRSDLAAERLLRTLQSTSEQADQLLPEMATDLFLYMPSQLTCSVLFKPVQTRLSRLLRETEHFATALYQGDEREQCLSAMHQIDAKLAAINFPPAAEAETESAAGPDPADATGSDNENKA